eukprot:TRINITY_DN9837_c0_g1_i1.p1 TRINITY_DN9837_c0_g1~~TRINITY_DN9837_c0_g1_i1.p1  ORF type:complete len:209 (+),score=42.19 TRINITY_DN9837_c0_g1_i1:1031-1657(+)
MVLRQFMALQQGVVVLLSRVEAGAVVVLVFPHFSTQETALCYHCGILGPLPASCPAKLAGFPKSYFGPFSSSVSRGAQQVAPPCGAPTTFPPSLGGNNGFTAYGPSRDSLCFTCRQPGHGARVCPQHLRGAGALTAMPSSTALVITPWSLQQTGYMHGLQQRISQQQQHVSQQQQISPKQQAQFQALQAQMHALQLQFQALQAHMQAL